MNRALTAICLAASLAAAHVANAQATTTHSPSTTTVLPTESIGSTEPTPEAPAAARHEAYAARAEAQRTCRHESDRDARRDCMAAANEDFRHLMARADGSA